MAAVAPAALPRPCAERMFRAMHRLVQASLCAAFAASPLAAQTAPEAATAATVDAFLAAFNATDSAAVAALLAPDIAVHDLAPDSNRTGVRGRSRVMTEYTPLLPGDPTHRMEVIERVVSGFHLMQRERVIWGDASWTQAVMYRVRDGRLWRVWYLPQEPDPASIPTIANPTFPRGRGPVVHIDEAHHNMHRAEGQFWPVAELLRRDGYVVRTFDSAFTAARLDTVGILVIANALAARNVSDWSLPTPSAFAPEEMDVLERWVRAGGSLLLIADHMPFPGAAMDLARRFGVTFTNSFARDTARAPGRGDAFSRAEGTLVAHAITDGTVSGLRVDSVLTFTGQAFRAATPFEPLLVFRASFVALLPEVAWEFSDSTPRESAGGWYQAAVAEWGEGRVAVFGEAALFRFLEADGGPADNPAFIRNLFRWLAGR